MKRRLIISALLVVILIMLMSRRENYGACPAGYPIRNGTKCCPNNKTQACKAWP